MYVSAELAALAVSKKALAEAGLGPLSRISTSLKLSENIQF